MASLQLVEGLIGTACAVACLYYARQATLAAEPHASLHNDAPWYGAVVDYAQRNPFAVVFGALALGFLLSSWSMYALPRSVAAPRMIEQARVITKTVVKADPAEAAKIATLQGTLRADAATIAAQATEIDRLKQLLARPARHSRHASATIAANPADANPQGGASDLDKAYSPAAAAAAANPPSSTSGLSTATAAANTPSVQAPAAGTANAAAPDSTTAPPH